MSGKVDVTGVVSNARRLAEDAELLKKYERYASAYALAVLAMEEIGKMLLKLWGMPASKIHTSKQRALSSLLMAHWAQNEYAPCEDTSEGQLDHIGRAASESFAGQLHHFVELGVFNRAKELALYYHDNPDGTRFQARVTPGEVESVLWMASLATEVVDDQRAMEAGLSIFRVAEEIAAERKRQRKSSKGSEAV